MIQGGLIDRIMVAGATALISVALHAGGVYKWTDENGHLHFTDSPPPGKQTQMHDVRPSSGTSGSSAGYSGLRPEEIERLKRVEQQEESDALRKKRAQEQYQRRISAEEQRKRSACESARERAQYYADKLHSGCDGGSCDYFKERREEYNHKAFEACR